MPKIKEDQCQFCRYFYPFMEHSEGGEGYCRRFPPVPKITKDKTVGVFAIVAAEEYCGEFQPMQKEDFAFKRRVLKRIEEREAMERQERRMNKPKNGRVAEGA